MKPPPPPRPRRPPSFGARKPAPTRDLHSARPYQAVGINWLAQKDEQGLNALLADAMRLGKTFQTARSFGPKERVIVVCPGIVAPVWLKEVLRWTDHRPLLNEPLRCPRPGEVLITSYDALPKPFTYQSQRRLIADDLRDTKIVLDEVHYAKNPEALRTRSVRALVAQSRCAVGLTGTPLDSLPADLWEVLVTLRLESIFSSRQEFDSAFATNGDVAPWLRRRLAAVMLRRTGDDVGLELPEVIVQDFEVEPPADLRDFLDDVSEEWQLADPNELPDFPRMSEARRALAEARIPDTLRLARTFLADGPLIVFGNHQATIHAMGTLGRSGIILAETPEAERTQVIADFQSGKIDLIALTVKIAGVGIDLSRADRILEVDQDWRPGVMSQARARAVAVGKKRGIHVGRMVTRHPLDLRVLEVLDRKERTSVQAVG